MSSDSLESTYSQNLTILCTTVEQSMGLLKPGQRMLIPLPPGWSASNMEPKFRAWCEVVGYTIEGFEEVAGSNLGVVLRKG